MRAEVAPGSLGAYDEMVDAAGQPLAGFGLDDCDALSGDHVAQTVTWRGNADVGRLAGQAVRMRIEWTKGKLYAFQFAR